MPEEKHHFGPFKFFLKPDNPSSIVNIYNDFLQRYEAKIRLSKDILPRLHPPVDESLKEELKALRKANSGIILVLNRLIKRSQDESTLMRKQFEKYITLEATKHTSRITPGYQQAVLNSIQTKITHVTDYLGLIVKTVQQQNDYFGLDKISIRDSDLQGLASLINSEILIERNFKKVILSLLKDLKAASAITEKEISEASRPVSITIRPLSQSTLREAVDLLTKIFPVQDPDEYAKIWFPASLDKRKYKAFFERAGITEARYWVAIAKGRVVGTIGLYSYKKDEREAYWMGWLGVDPMYRGRGIGVKLVEFSINMARKSGKKFIRLYTSNDPNEAKAQDLYEKYHFGIIDTQAGINHPYNIIFRELKL